MGTRYRIPLIAAIVLATSLCSVSVGSETEEIKVVIERKVPVSMRDGVILQADVYRPDRGRPYPVLVGRTPYGKGRNFNRYVEEQDMKKTGLILTVLVVSTGYAQQRLAMMDARSEPAKFSPGDETIVSVRVIDTQGVVAEVTATVREERSIILDLNDSGEAGDKVARDGVWSVAFEVPDEASAGEYNWDFEALDANGDPVKVLTKEGSEEPLTAEVSVEVVSRTQRPADPTHGDNLSSTSRIAGIKISELMSPVIEVPLKSKDGIDLSFAYRTPPGKGPYPAILFFHGGGGQSNLEILKHDLLTGVVQTRFLQAGFIIVAATRRPYWKSTSANQPTGFYDAVEDARLIIERAKTLPGIQADNVILYGGSGGGILAIVAASKTDLACVVAGEPATVIALDPRIGTETTPRYYNDLMENPAKSLTEERRHEIHSWMKDVECPVLVLQGKHVGLYKTNFEFLIPEMKKLNKDISSIHYPGVTHGFYWGREKTGATLDTVEKVVKDVTAYIEKHTTIERANCDIIYFAASRGDMAEVEALVRKGIDVSAADAQGCTALHYAAQEGHKNVVELLLSKGANINAKNNDGKTPFEVAASQRHKDVAALLAEAGAEIPTIHIAAFVGSLDKLRNFIQAGMDVDAKDENGRTPLLRAIKGGHIDAVKFLIEAGADVNRRDEQGYVPLVHALWSLDPAMVRLLVESGADVHVKDTSGYTPLHWAVMMGSTELTELMLDARADVNAKSTRGETPMDLARQGGPQIVELLWKHGAKE